jgi:hypothetical protein
MKWVTRARPKVDRIACPWLIRRFIDPDAKILYVSPDQVMAVVRTEDATPFDVADVELGHQDKECTFDAIMKKYNLGDPALQRLAIIVRGADTEAKDLAPECRGLEAIAEGFGLSTKTIKNCWSMNCRSTTPSMLIVKKSSVDEIKPDGDKE